MRNNEWKSKLFPPFLSPTPKGPNWRPLSLDLMYVYHAEPQCVPPHRGQYGNRGTKAITQQMFGFLYHMARLLDWGWSLSSNHIPEALLCLYE